jgi:hypothetical protein
VTTWSKTIYVDFPDEDAARAMAMALGVEFPEDGSIPTGNGNYAMVAPIVEWVRRPVSAGREIIDQGERRPGYTAMIRLNMDWPGYAAAMAMLAAVAVDLPTPSNRFA